MNGALKTFLLLPLLLATGAGAADLRVNFLPRFNGAPLVFDAPTNQTAAGQKISVTRLDFLLSNVALRRPDGAWLGQQAWFAHISARDGKTGFTLADIPAGSYDRIRFQIGLPPEINHGDPAQWPANHPLNPNASQLYWSWSKEYIFLALEGGWKNGGRSSGFSFHLATDRELMTVELPVQLDLAAGRELQIALNTDQIFSTPNQIQLSDSTDSSHSRTNDTLAVRLHENIQHAFAIVSNQSLIQAATTLAPADGTKGRPLIAPGATPYRFTFAAYFPQPDLPRDNPLTGEGVSLGGKLFFDRRLSKNNSQNCAACHRPGEGFSEPRRFSRGVDGLVGTRNAMPLENLAWKSSFFWDGRAATLREQVLQPIQNPIEMHESLANVVAKLNGRAGSPLPADGAHGVTRPINDNDYPRLFTAAFGSPEITADRIARALEQFLLVQTSFDSKFDHAVYGSAQFTEEEKRGFQLFHTEYDPYHGQYGADCFHCHGGPLFQSQNFGNNGLDAVFHDQGRYIVTKRNGDQGKFAVPSLRNVAVTAPYMHDGRFRTLEEVVEHYCTGMKRSPTLDPNLAKHPDGGLPLSTADKKALVAFLKTLTDEKYLHPTPVSATAAR